MNWKVLVSAPYMQNEINRFKPFFKKNGINIIVPKVNERLSENELLPIVTDIDGVIAGDDQFTERVLKKATRLKVISKWGTGIDSFDLDACKRLKIAVRNTPNAFSEPVADSVMGYILCFARNLVKMDQEMKSGKWNKIPGKALWECCLGVIGVGNVGKAVVRRAKAFGIQILGNDIVEISDEFIKETSIKMVDKETLLKKSDFISLNCDLNPTSYHLIDRSQLSIMKKSAYLINLARGPIIKETDLIEALRSRFISGAALDVFENEPLSSNSPLLKMDNVFTAPHNSNSSPETWERVHWNTINNLIEELEGRA